jgi:hypothetical protein
MLLVSCRATSPYHNVDLVLEIDRKRGERYRAERILFRRLNPILSTGRSVSRNPVISIGQL